MKKIAVFAGAFDPVHLGHAEFVRNSIKNYDLDEVHVLIEKNSPHKQMIASLEDRVAMVKLAFIDFPQVKILNEYHDKYPISSYLPELKSKTEGTVYLLVGQDVMNHIHQWPDYQSLLYRLEIIVAKRSDETEYGSVSSLKIRKELRDHKNTTGLDRKVLDYISDNRLYL